MKKNNISASDSNTNNKFLESLRLHSWELAVACVNIKRAYKRIENLLEDEAQQGSPYEDLGPLVGEVTYVHEFIHEVLNNAARIQKILICETKGRKESSTDWNIRKKRVNMFAKLLSKLEIQEITSSRVRNSIEHIDTRLDKCVVKHPEKSYVYRLVVRNAKNFVSLLDEHPYLKNATLIRVFCVESKDYYCFDDKVNIRVIYNETLRVIEYIRESMFQNEGENLIYEDGLIYAGDKIKNKPFMYFSKRAISE